MVDRDTVFVETYLQTYAPFADEERTRAEALGAVAVAGVEHDAEILDCPTGLVRFWFNPPLSRLEEEVKPHADFAIYLGLVSPRLEARSFASEPVDCVGVVARHERAGTVRAELVL
jgi:hypothetical protein